MGSEGKREGHSWGSAEDALVLVFVVVDALLGGTGEGVVRIAAVVRVALKLGLPSDVAEFYQ